MAEIFDPHKTCQMNICWSSFFSLLTVLGACKNKFNLNISLHMTSVGFQDTQAQYPPSEFLHVLNYCYWFLPWRKLVRSASDACRFWFLCVSDIHLLNGNQVFSYPLCIFSGDISGDFPFGGEVMFLWMCGLTGAKESLTWPVGGTLDTSVMLIAPPPMVFVVLHS